MDILPGKSLKGIWIIAMIVLVLVVIHFLNTYAGPNRQPLFGFLKKSTPAQSV